MSIKDISKLQWLIMLITFVVAIGLGAFLAKIITDKPQKTSEATTISTSPTPPNSEKLLGQCSNGGAPCVDSASEVASKKWSLDFSDEFNGTSLDKNKWADQRGPNSPGYGDPFNPDMEDAFYKPGNVTVANGNLTLTIKQESASGYPYTSGVVQSERSYSFPSGSFIESSIKIPSCSGCWPAFWTLDMSADQHWPPEIDIFEMFGTQSDKKPQFNYHWSASGNQQSGPSAYGSLNDYTGSYHIYGLYWNGNKAIPYLDGIAYPSVGVTSNMTKANQFIIYDLAVQKGSKPTNGSHMLVDWVRVWKPSN